ncbi:MAG: type II and III secretion system protein family protein [Nitrospiraceae bacterium]|nr:MAG: type II and III secretion system protein family protein [Nitrospiraceae bacterium]
MMKIEKTRNNYYISGVIIAVFIICIVIPFNTWGDDYAQEAPLTVTPQVLSLNVGKSLILESMGKVSRVSIADPEIVDAIVITPNQIYLTGKAGGSTNLSLWQKDKLHAIYNVDVSIDVTSLKKKLYEILPEENDIRVTGNGSSIALSGRVSSASALSQVLAIADTYAPKDKNEKGKVMNLLEVGGVHQVMLEVRVAEITRDVGKRLGINFNSLGPSGRTFGVNKLNNLSSMSQLAGVPVERKFDLFPPGGEVILPDKGFPADPLQISGFTNLLFRFLGGDYSWTVLIDALKDEGLISVLAEPTLIALSGQSANFLAGGEFPVPMPQGLGTVAIMFKKFGVGLTFTPTVLSNNKINMKVAPEVSELDFSIATEQQGFLIPGLTTRQASTVVELGDGQSFAIAGLLQENVRENITKFPVLGDIPVLGTLFRSSAFQKNESELVIIVTPHLVKPLDMAKQTLPTDQFIEPSDYEFYIKGTLEGKEDNINTSSSHASQVVHNEKGGLEGDFGHIIPE